MNFESPHSGLTLLLIKTHDFIPLLLRQPRSISTLFITSLNKRTDLNLSIGPASKASQQILHFVFPLERKEEERSVGGGWNEGSFTTIPIHYFDERFQAVT